VYVVLEFLAFQQNVNFVNPHVNPTFGYFYLDLQNILTKLSCRFQVE